MFRTVVYVRIFENSNAYEFLAAGITVNKPGKNNNLLIVFLT